MLVIAIIWCIWLNRNSMIFRNQSRSYILLIFQIISLLTSWIGSLLSGPNSEVFSHAIHHMQQEWDQAHASQAALDIASSIGIASVPTPPSAALVVVDEVAVDQLVLNPSVSGN